MSGLRVLASLAAIALLLLPTVASMQAVQPPCRFYGTVRVGGASVPDGTVITAIIEGDVHTTVTPAV